MTNTQTVQQLQSPSNNKAVGAGAGGLGGGLVGIAFVAYLDYRGVVMSQELAATVAGGISTVAAAIGAYFAPILTVAQQAIIHKLQHENP